MVVELEHRRLCEDLIIHSGTRIKEVEVEPLKLVAKNAGGGPAGLVGPRALKNREFSKKRKSLPKL